MVMSKFNFAVLISGSGSNLQAMIDAIDSKIIDGSICCVLSNNPDAYGLKRAKKADIPVEVINHREFASREEFDEAMIKKLYKAQGFIIKSDSINDMIDQNNVYEDVNRIVDIENQAYHIDKDIQLIKGLEIPFWKDSLKVSIDNLL